MKRVPISGLNPNVEELRVAPGALGVEHLKDGTASSCSGSSA